MRKLRHTGAGTGVGCCVCNRPAALTPDDPKGPLTPHLRLHPPPRLPRPQGLPLLQERRRHRLLSIHVPAEGRAGRGPGPKPDQEPGSAAPQVSKSPGAVGVGWAGLDLLLESGQLGETLGRTLAGRLSQAREGPTPTIAQVEKSRLGGERPAEAQVGLQVLPRSLGTSSGLNLPRGLGGRFYYPFYRWDS